MALVGGIDDGEVGDLLVIVVAVDVELVVVDANPGIGVAADYGDLDGGEQDVGGGDVEGEDGGILDGEAGLFGLEDDPDDEDHDEDEEGDDEECGA